jgi:hypothetical protein
MPEIQVTDDQLERLDALREELAAEVVGKYGHVRRRDAVEYLLDQHAEGTESGGTAGEAPGGDGDAVDPSSPTSGAGSGPGPGSDPGSGSGSGTDASPAESRGERGDETRVVPEGNGAGADADAAGGAGAEGDDDGGAMLDAMMNLLSEHEDKWREASGGDARYEVDLPDGSTDQARTKDDVRALLFEHYR